MAEGDARHRPEPRGAHPERRAARQQHGLGRCGLRALLWAEPRSLAILEALERAAAKVEGVISGQRKGYTSFSRAVQFAAVRPLKGGRALLGLKLDPALSPRLAEAVRRESWSERLSAVVELDGPGAVNDEIGRLFAQAAENG